MNDSITNSQYYSNDISIKRNKIEKYSNRISKVLVIGKYFCMLFAIVYAVFSIGILIESIRINVDSDFLVKLTKIVMPMVGSDWSHNATEYIVVMYGFSAVLLSVISLQISYLHNTIKDWGNGVSPFNTKHIRGMRHSAIFTSLALFMFQPLYVLYGVFIFVFTYLMEYGSVLEINAVNTIKSHEQMILSLSEVIEAKSGQTGLHVKRVSEYARILAEGAGLPTEVVEEIRVASMLHDVGKLLVPSEILEKPGKLTDQEFEQIKNHTRYGYDLLEKTSGSVLNKAKTIASEHHEKWDGTGYSNKKGNEISFEARIVAVADVYDALVSKRSYKDAWSSEDARNEIDKSSGSHFDPEVVKIFDKQYSKILEITKRYGDVEKFA